MGGNGGIFEFGRNVRIWWIWRYFRIRRKLWKYSDLVEMVEFLNSAEMAEFSNSAEIVEILGFSGNGGLVKFGGNY